MVASSGLLAVLAGPWTDLPAAGSSPLWPIGEQGFFRVKVSSFAEASEDKEE